MQQFIGQWNVAKAVEWARFNVTTNTV